MVGHMESSIFATFETSGEYVTFVFEAVLEETNKDRRAFEFDSRKRIMTGRSCLSTSSLTLLTCIQGVFDGIYKYMKKLVGDVKASVCVCVRERERERESKQLSKTIVQHDLQSRKDVPSRKTCPHDLHRHLPCDHETHLRDQELS